MKKICLIAVLALTMVQFAMGMIPGPPLLLECPKCGEEKRMMSIISGNTFGATQWSDMYRLERNDADRKLNQENIKALIGLLNRDDNDNTLLIAELYREAGYFESCLNTLEKYRNYSRYERYFMEQLDRKAMEKNDRPFIIDE